MEQGIEVIEVLRALESLDWSAEDWSAEETLAKSALSQRSSCHP